MTSNVSKWSQVDEIEIPNVKSDDFWKGISIFCDRPHILNKRISTINIVETIYLLFNDSSIQFTWEEFAHEVIIAEGINVQTLNSKFGASVCSQECDAGVVIQIRSHISKMTSKQQLPEIDILIKDKRNNIIVFLLQQVNNGVNQNKLIPQLTYAFDFVKDQLERLRLHIWNFKEDSDGNLGLEWLRKKVLPKIAKWSLESSQPPSTHSLKLSSLSLVSSQRYVEMYHYLKNKYGPKLVQIWPEKTDPHKFVYEDIGLAAYLIIIWETQRQDSASSQKQKFVDLGCGNGLLVHILCSEGYTGMGIDIKKRKIWDYFGSSIILKEDTYVPSPSYLFPEFDWIIGNHSDELTPWIPVIAARSSPKTCFFLLPCCAHNFDSKFQRRNSKISQYEDYIEFVREVVKVCGFKDEIDKLRIPSTKRICLVGRHRTFEPEMWSKIDLNIEHFIKNNCIRRDKVLINGRTWADTFQPRPAVQQTRNCTTLEKSVKESILMAVFNELLKGSDETQSVLHHGTKKTWRVGGIMELCDLVKSLKLEDLQKLKSEFGGLQTLIKNHQYIFYISQGKVQLRNYLTTPSTIQKKRRKKDFDKVNNFPKTKPCWFHVNHPDGCLLEADKCQYIHSENFEINCK